MSDTDRINRTSGESPTPPTIKAEKCDLHGNPIRGTTRLLCVIGDPIRHTLSPIMHNLALREHGLDMRYMAFHVVPDRLEVAVRGLTALGCVGFNATLPHKEALIDLMDDLDHEARLVGAVNTVAIGPEGRLSGYNTDVYGFLTSIEARFPGKLRHGSVLLIGAGGAARAVLAGLIQGGAETIWIANRTRDRADRMVEEMASTARVLSLEERALPLEEVDILINATRLGLHGESVEALSNRALRRLPKRAAVVDIVYSPKETPLLRAARHCGLSTQDGLDMLIYQGARAFQIWTGRDMPVDTLSAHLRT